MGQETTVHHAAHDRHTMPSAPGAYNGVSTAMPMPGSARLIPLGQFPQRLNDINPADDIVVHCKVGGRSAQAYEVLKQAGYTRIKNLKGGILAWADQVDRSMQKY